MGLWRDIKSLNDRVVVLLLLMILLADLANSKPKKIRNITTTLLYYKNNKWQFFISKSFNSFDWCKTREISASKIVSVVIIIAIMIVVRSVVYIDQTLHFYFAMWNSQIPHTQALLLWKCRSFHLWLASETMLQLEENYTFLWQLKLCKTIDAFRWIECIHYFNYACAINAHFLFCGCTESIYSIVSANRAWSSMWTRSIRSHTGYNWLESAWSLTTTLPLALSCEMSLVHAIEKRKFIDCTEINKHIYILFPASCVSFLSLKMRLTDEAN